MEGLDLRELGWDQTILHWSVAIEVLDHEGIRGTNKD